MSANPQEKLIKILQNAHAGELAATFAYRGHWKSVKNKQEKEQIKKIEAEEWLHRENVFHWLEKLDAQPRKLREAVFWIIGRSLGVLCYVSGWFLPMYFAGRLESQNTKEYEDAANLAKELQMSDCFDEMMEMSVKEQEHEEFFRQTVANHRFLPLMKRVFNWS